MSDIEIRYQGRLVVTAGQALEQSDRWPSASALRGWISRNGVTPAAYLDVRTPLYLPEDLGIIAPSGDRAGQSVGGKIDEE